MLLATKPGSNPSSDGAPPADKKTTDPGQERHDDEQPRTVARHSAMQQRQRGVVGAVGEMLEDRNGPKTKPQ